MFAWFFTSLTACTTDYTPLAYFVMHVCILFTCSIAGIISSFIFFNVCLHIVCMGYCMYNCMPYWMYNNDVYVPCIFCNACLHVLYMSNCVYNGKYVLCIFYACLHVVCMSYCFYNDIYILAYFKIKDRPLYTPKLIGCIFAVLLIWDQRCINNCIRCMFLCCLVLRACCMYKLNCVQCVVLMQCACHVTYLSISNDCALLPVWISIQILLLICLC